jgi:predicted RNase H-like nuclease (RuvC/YqgF family)
MSTKDSTDEEIIDVLLPVTELRRENSELHAEVERLRANALMWRKQHDVACETVERNIAENERLRAALKKIAKDSYRDGHVAWATEALGSWQT